MLSKNKIKLIKSLSQKKNRDEYGLFIAEGTKLVIEMLPHFQCVSLFVTTSWLKAHPTVQALEIIEIAENELQKITNQKNPQGVLALFKKPDYEYKTKDLKGKLSLALDDIQDPGNLGTIIRVADWFGIKDIFCSLHTVDVYGTKTIQATMGALSRVRVHYVDLAFFLKKCSGELLVYGTFMDGKNIYKEKLYQNGIIVMGNEGNGISKETEQYIYKRLLIPNFPEGESTTESLNVGIATALVCAEFRRRQR